MGQEIAYSKDIIRDLIDGKLPWEITQRIISDLKDSNRFDLYVEILQERVGFEERILLPLTEHLYIVEKGVLSISKNGTLWNQTLWFNQEW